MGIIEILLATACWGVVVGWDSLVYFDFTRDPKASAFFSPFFPIVLSALARTGPGRQTAARYLGAALFGATVALAMTTTRRDARDWRTPLLAGTFVLTSWLLVNQFVKAMSDPLALVLGFSGLYLVARHLEEAARWRLLVGAGAIGLALATRYASLPFAITGALGLLARRGPAGNRRIGEALIFTILAVLPAGVWVAYNLVSTGGYVTREIVWHPPHRQIIVKAFQELSTWLLPPRVPAAARFLFLGAVVCGIAWLMRFDGTAAGSSSRSPFSVLLRRFIVAYALFLFGVMTFVDATVTFGRRHWLPVYFACLLLVVGLLDRPLRQLRPGPRRRALTLALSIYLAVEGTATAVKAYLLARDGAEYSGRQMQSSVLRILREAPYSGRPVYTDDPQAVEYLIGRPAQRLPSKFNPLTRKEVPRFAVELERLRREIHLHGAIVARFAQRPTSRYPNVNELEDAESLVVIARDDTVTIRGPAP